MVQNDPYGAQNGQVMMTSDGNYLIQAPTQSLHFLPEVQIANPMTV